MSTNNMLNRLTMKNQNLYYKLKIIFGLFFIFPILGFLYFGIKYDILNDEYTLLYLLGVLVFSYFGYSLLRKLFDEIGNLSKTISLEGFPTLANEEHRSHTSELQNIIQSFNTIENQFKTSSIELAKRASEISTLKELSELCYMTFDPKEILYITLERSLLLTGSDVGSVMILEEADTKKFIVRAAIGHGEQIQIGDEVDFEKSIAKYAVINKSPLVVKDIEKDTRFGRTNLSHYGTKSFICMPIKTSQAIVGVLTISRRENDRQYELKDVEILTPLLSNAAFTYENIRLVRENKQFEKYPKSIEKVFKVLNSSIQDRELLTAILTELQNIVPFNYALVMLKDTGKPDHINIFDLFATEPINLNKGTQYAGGDTIMDKVMKQDTTLVISDTIALAEAAEKELFADQNCRSCILSPLKMGGTVFGLLSLSAENPDIFYEVFDLMPWMANVLSFTIERNRLLSSMAKRNQELDTIRQIGSALASSTFDINQVLNYTMDMIRVVMNTEAGSLMLIKGDELEFAATFNIKVEGLKGYRIKMGQGIAGYSADRGEVIIENDVQNSPQFHSDVDASTGFTTRSALCMPIISQGKVIGVIEVLNKIDGDFNANDKDLLQSVASSVSIAIENAHLYKKTVSLAEHERSVRGMFQKFVPKEILDKILHNTDDKQAVIEEMKTLTLLNIDIRGFTGLTRKIGPQKTISLLNSFFSVMGDIVFKKNGIVDKYLGDGFLALFGAPVSSTMDADNAISAALAMQKALPRVDDYFVKEIGASMDIGISIHTGEVVVGNFGFDMKMDYTVIGDPVNIVFRMQGLTRSFPNGILISENTSKAARSHLDAREVAIKDSKGILKGLKIYELLGQKR